ncbi:oxidoreductase [Rickettsia japonica]|uniref:Oxidoreductase, partial n=1 Tax=Rickettsia japonica TaxID=35790 RepID=A0AAD1CC65_RICJA|nr:oxidoreductase [Rickettsia japonica]
MKELGTRAVFYQGINLEKPDEIHSMFERIIKEFGKIDILVNNAGIQHVAAIDEFPKDKWEQVLRIDLIASFYTTYAIQIIKKTVSDELLISLPLMHMSHHLSSRHM